MSNIRMSMGCDTGRVGVGQVEEINYVPIVEVTLDVSLAFAFDCIILLKFERPPNVGNDGAVVRVKQTGMN